MENCLIIGSGISGLACATDIDSIEAHTEDTVKGGAYLEERETVEALCKNAPDTLEWLEKHGMVFTRTEQNTRAVRFMAGHTYARTAFAGTATGKMIVTALTRALREYECAGMVKRIYGLHFHSALLDGNTCCGAIFCNAMTGELVTMTAQATVVATGGQNCLFGKTTGSLLCDGYAAGKLFEQGAVLRDLEFIQYHPTAIETPQKRMLISEAARGEGGRLYYEQGGKKVYFMEDAFGEKGNLMPRDIVARHVAAAPSQVYLDISFLGAEKIRTRLQEVADLCKTYINLDVTKEPIPIAPSVHFFMGGLAVDAHHRTSIERLYAVGECASHYHGANRLGGNSLLSAVFSGRVAAQSVAELPQVKNIPDFSAYVQSVQKNIAVSATTQSKYPACFVQQELAQQMMKSLGIVRTDNSLLEGLANILFYEDIIGQLHFDRTLSLYENYRLSSMLTLAHAILLSAQARKESRGSHFRSDYPKTSSAYDGHTYVRYNGGKYDISFEKGVLVWS